MTPAEMAEAITAIRTGGGDSAVAQKDVNFYDYDGTLLYSYTIAEAQELTELPAAPEHEGLVFQSWNYTLDSVKTTTQMLNVGATYITFDGKTRIFIHLEEGRTSPMLGLAVLGTVDVDWGDGTDHDTLTGNSLMQRVFTPNHEYAEPGDYVITLAVVSGEMHIISSDGSDEYSAILRHRSLGDKRNRVYQNSVLKVFIGSNVTIGQVAFYYCTSLQSVVIPEGITSIGRIAFDYCYSLKGVVIPKGVTSIGNNAFSYCYSLKEAILPVGITSIGSDLFSGCDNLNTFVIPEGVTEIQEKQAFRLCRTLKKIVIPKSVTSIGSGAFTSCERLASVVLPEKLVDISGSLFYGCSTLINIKIPKGVTSIGSSAFYLCGSVKLYDFSQHESVPALSNTNAFTGIAADCEIRVPAALYDEWISATNWATYASNIVAV